MKRSFILLAFFIQTWVAVAAEPEARALATTLRSLMLQYDAKVEAKAATEEQFYLDQQKTLRDLWLPGITFSTNAGLDKTNSIKAAEGSIPYLAITVSAQRSANELAEKLAIDPAHSSPFASLVADLAKGLKEDQDLFKKAQLQQQTLRTELGATLAEIDLQNARRKDIREALLKLEANPSLNQQLKALYKIGEAVQKQLKEKSKKESAN